MAREVLEREVIQGKDFIREKWVRLTEEDVRQINGNYDMLINKLLQRYGYTREQAEEEIRKWNFERANRTSYQSDRSNLRMGDREKIAQSNSGSSFYKWFLALVIPLALLTLLFFNNRSMETTATPPAGYEQITVSGATPADQSMVQAIRQAFIANNISLQDLRNVRLSASNGIVTINGSVDTTQKRDTIGLVLQKALGVKQVNNNLEVRP